MTQIQCWTPEHRDWTLVEPAIMSPIEYDQHVAELPGEHLIRSREGEETWGELTAVIVSPPVDLSGGNPTYLRILAYMVSLHVAKARGYVGDSPDTWQNFRESETIGIPTLSGVMVRLLDKDARLRNLFVDGSNDQLVGENFIKTAIDKAAYSLIAACIYAEEHPEALEEALKEVK